MPRKKLGIDTPAIENTVMAAVERRVAVDRGNDPQGERDHDREEKGGEAELQRDRNPRPDLRRDRPLALDRLAEVPVQHVVQPDRVLHGNRVVQVELLPIDRNLFFGERLAAARADKRGNRIARQQQLQREYQEGDQDQDRYCLEQPPGDVRLH